MYVKGSELNVRATQGLILNRGVGVKLELGASFRIVVVFKSGVLISVHKFSGISVSTSCLLHVKLGFDLSRIRGLVF